MRTPSMTVAAAETLLASRGWPRGSLKVIGGKPPDENRSDVKKWIVANGFPALFAGGLSYVEMEMAYNKTDGTGLARLRDKLAKDRMDRGLDPNDSSQDDDSDESPVAPAPAPAAPNGHANPDALDLFEVMKRIAGKSISPEQVSTIVDEKMAELKSAIESRVDAMLQNAKPSRLDIVINGATVNTIDGMTHKAFPELTVAVAAGLPCFLPGPAGAGKTTAAEQVAKALGMKFYIQGAVSGAHELLGYFLPQVGYITTAFRQAFEHGGLLCLDEIDGGDAGALLVLNAALANCYMTFPDSPEPIQRHPDFRVVACANTLGLGQDRQYVGRTQLDAATLDRFYFLLWGYDAELEMALCGDATGYNARAIDTLVPVEMTPARGADWCGRVQRLRNAAQGERIIISPRASLMGLKALAAGLSPAQVENALVWKGLAADKRAKIERAA